jgi:hypothetical protein
MEELGPEIPAEFPLADIPVQKPDSTAAFSPLGEPVTPEEVAARLSKNLYDQLSEKSDEVTAAAISRASIYVGAILRRLNVPYNLDDSIVREVVLINTVYELHIALGHEEAGREYRLKARDIILAAWGGYPDTDNAAPEKAAAAAVVLPKTKRGFNGRY